jgi:glutamate synthase (NADPH/NADH) large chain
VTLAHGSAGLPDDTIEVDFVGSAGNSFGAFLPRGVTLRLEGDANDYVGKGLSGGRLVVRPSGQSTFAAEENIIAGNVIGYGATGGQIFLRGIVGERFCVRNSGATAVVEGVGDHGCEYMTGGRVVVLGPTGRNFGAGMSGGIAYAFDPNFTFEQRLNREMVAVEALEDEDRRFLREAIETHWRETDSPVARQILDDFDSAVEQFRKVMPTDYRKVLVASALAEAEGRDVSEAIMEAARG